MTKNVFSCDAVIPNHGIKSMSDKGVRVMIDTQEILPEQMAALFALKGKYGHFYFAEAPLSPDQIEVPEITADFKGEKSPSQRLRASLYILWQQSGTSQDFEIFYRSKMENIIDSIKNKLD